MKKNKGITLVALVVTIVIMLILAGVTLNLALSDNGLFKMAEKTVDTYQAEGEREAIQESILAYQLGENTNQEGIEESKLGDTLLDKGLEHQDDWHEVQTTDDKKWYGTDWNLVEEGDDLGGYGKAQNSWLVNYETGEIKKLEEGKYKSVTIHDTIAVEDSLILNLDSAMTDEGVANDKDSIEQRLGEGAVTLNYFTYDIDGLIDNEFVFDGDNDYITIDLEKLKKSGENEQWFQNGFTFEFYGNINEGKRKSISPEYLGEELKSEDYVGKEIPHRTGIFQVTEEDDSKKGNVTRVLALAADCENFVPSDLLLCFPSTEASKTNVSDSFDYDNITRWWKKYSLHGANTSNDHFAISVEKGENGNFTQTFYEDGNPTGQTGELNKNCIEVMAKLEAKLLTVGCFESGYDPGSYFGSNKLGVGANMSKIHAKCLRIYNRGLTPTEVWNNYEQTTYYHNEVMGKELK